MLNLFQIKDFFLENFSFCFGFIYVLYMFSVDKSNLNLNDRNEEKKSFVRKKALYFVEEVESIVKNNKKTQLMEVSNLTKLSSERLIFEYNIDGKITQFEKINLYLPEHRELFEPTKTEKNETEVFNI